MTVLFAAQMDADERSQWLQALRAAMPGETLADGLDGVDPGTIDAAIVASPAAGALQGLPALRLVQSLWAGVDRLLRDQTLPATVPLARMVDPAMNEAMAETALWAVLSLHRGFFGYAQQQQRAEWRQQAQRRSDELQVAVLGLGQMGAAVARRLAGNGYGVVGWSRRTASVPDIAALHGEAALPRVLAQAEVVINLLPLTPLTLDFFDARRFAQMRPGASLVNLARGAQVVEADLLHALAAGSLRHAVLDVFREEPLPPGHAFWSHPRITVLPHAAALTDPRSAAAVVADNVAALRAGRPLRHLVDRARGY